MTHPIKIIELSDNEAEANEQCKEIAWQMFAQMHPVEAHQKDPDKFWEYFHTRSPDMTREQMVALLKECEEK